MDIKEYIDTVCKGNKAKAARELGFSYASLLSYLSGRRLPNRKKVINAFKKVGIDTIKIYPNDLTN